MMHQNNNHNRYKHKTSFYDLKLLFYLFITYLIDAQNIRIDLLQSTINKAISNLVPFFI